LAEPADAIGVVDPLRGTSGSGVAAVHVVWTARMPRRSLSLVMAGIDAVLR
jgi:hypothetical protein